MLTLGLATAKLIGHMSGHPIYLGGGKTMANFNR